MDLKINLDMVAEEVGQHMLNARLIWKSGDADDIAEGMRALGAARGLCKTVLAHIKGLGGEYDEEERRFSDNLHESRKLFQKYLNKFSFGIKLQVSHTEEGPQLRASLTPAQPRSAPGPRQDVEAVKEHRMPGEKPPAVTQEEIDAMQRHKLAGMSNADIAKKMGRNENTVWRYTRNIKSKTAKRGGVAKLDMFKAREIRELYKHGSSLAELAIAYGVSSTSIYAIVQGQSYREE